MRDGSVVELLSPDENTSLVWQDENYYAVTTPAGFALSRMSDHKVIFSEVPSDLNAIELFVAPDERTVLVSRQRSPGFVPGSMSLTSDTVQRIVTTIDGFTRPAWTTSGAIFAFAERNTAGWMLKIMDRNGKMLRKINLPAYATDIAYDSVRWTSCD
jgi:hypothetical protein